MKGLKTLQSDFSVTETVEILKKAIEKQGWHLFAHINHAKQAQNKGLQLRPTQVLLFGNPKVGTLLMQDQQSAAIDLPVKALVYEDEKGRVLIAYNTTTWLRERHQLTDEITIKEISTVLKNVCNSASKK